MKKVIFLIIVVIGMVIIFRLVVSIIELWHKKDVLTAVEKQLVQQEKENKYLKKQLTVVQSRQFIEEEARNKLFLVKPGESTILINQSLLKIEDNSKKETSQIPIWQRWLRLFF